MKPRFHPIYNIVPLKCKLREDYMVYPLLSIVGWEMRFTEDHVRYFVDHNTRWAKQFLIILSKLCFDTKFFTLGQPRLKTQGREVPKKVLKEPTECLLSMRGPSGLPLEFCFCTEWLLGWRGLAVKNTPYMFLSPLYVFFL